MRTALDRIGEAIIVTDAVLDPPAPAARVTSSACRMPVTFEHSLTGACFRTRETIVCDDTQEDARAARATARRAGIRSGIFVPLVDRWSCLGVLLVYSNEPRQFAARHRSLLELASGVLISALRLARTYSAEVSRRALLLDALPTLVAYIGANRRYREVNTRYEEWFGLPASGIRGRHIREVVGEEVFEGVRPHVEAALRGEHVHYEEVVDIAGRGGARRLQGEYLPDRDRDGTVKDFYAVVHDVTDAWATRSDHLTGLANRRHFEGLAEQILPQARRHGHDVSLVFCDIDRFKSVNDSHGHAAGDDALRAFAIILRSQLRESDVAARLGGEEFVLLLPETDLHGAHRLAERVRLAIAGHDFPVVGRVTAIFGVATFGDEDDLESMLERADAALYRAKRSGRNRVSVAGADE